MNARLRHMVLATGVCLSVALFGCGGSGGSSSEAPADIDEGVEEVAEEEEPAESEAAPSELGTVDLEVASSDYHYELTEVASFEGDRRDVSFQYDGAIAFDDDGNPMLVGADGKPLCDGATIRSIEYWADGIYAVALDADDINDTGLVSMTEGELVPFEAAAITYATDDPADARFLEVIYATEQTDDEDECFIYATEDMVSVSIGEDDVMYKGYAKVFDLKKGAFVDGVKIDNGSRTALKDLGDSFLVEEKDGTTTMYSPKGKELWSTKDYPDVGKNSLCISGSDGYQIINAKGTPSFTTDGYLNTLASTDDLYILNNGDEDAKVIDSEGRVALDGGFESVTGEYGGMFVIKQDGKTVIVDPKGETLADDVQDYTAQSIIPGYIMYQDGDDNRIFFKSDGTTMEIKDGSFYDMVCYDGSDYLVLKDGSYSLTLDGVDTLDLALVRAKADGSDAYTVYDLFTGEQVLDDAYEVVDWAGGYVYAFKDGTWTVFEAKRVQA